MKSVFNKAFKNEQNSIDGFVKNFDTTGEVFGNQKRNTIKLFKLNAETVNIKSFKTPNIFNQIVYKFFRKSKAQRSFEYANKLIKLQIGTPQPIAYFEFTRPFLFNRSFYVSEHLECDLTYREMTSNFNFPDYDNILRAFTRFTYTLHEKGVHFLDHSPGNTLIKKIGNDYHFYLVDLNRMNFGTMDFETRIKNFSRLTIHKAMVETMSDEYAKCSGVGYNKIFNLMWKETKGFQEKVQLKRKLKMKLKSKK